MSVVDATLVQSGAIAQDVLGQLLESMLNQLAVISTNGCNQNEMLKILMNNKLSSIYEVLHINKGEF